MPTTTTGSVPQSVYSLLPLIEKKRDGRELSNDEVEQFIHHLSQISDAQLGAFLMALYLKGLSPEETLHLTKHMRDSGVVLGRPSADSFRRLDKHSTGGVGDKISLILAPLIVAVSRSLPTLKPAVVPMIAGRSLGHTGGTIDKLESIPGFKTAISLEDFQKQVYQIGCAIIAQTEDLAPADKRIYKTRDITGTVPSVPLITASILSKKTAENLDGLLLDLKVGEGAFMTSIESARELGVSLKRVSEALGLKINIVYTLMDQPLGSMVGNAFEVLESLAVMNPVDEKIQKIYHKYSPSVFGCNELKSMCERMTEMMLGFSSDQQPFPWGSVYQIFEQMVNFQGGDLNLFLTQFESKIETLKAFEFKSNQDGWLSSLSALTHGRLLTLCGAGRMTPGQSLQPWVGVVHHKKIGEPVASGEVVFTAYLDTFWLESQSLDLNKILHDWSTSFQISKEPVSFPNPWVESSP